MRTKRKYYLRRMKFQKPKTKSNYKKMILSIIQQSQTNFDKMD